MDILENPFCVLKATSRDNRSRLMELAEELSLEADSELFAQARSVLTNPRKRLSAEVAWLPGVSPRKCCAVLGWLSGQVVGRPKSSTMNAYPPLPRANILAGGLRRLKNRKASKVVQWILELAWAFEDIEPQKVLGIINEERILSGFPEITDLAMVETEIQARRLHYSQAIRSALDRMEPRELVSAVTLAIETATESGLKHGPVLIDDLVDTYEVEAQVFFGVETANIEVLVKEIESLASAEAPELHLAQGVEILVKVLKNWDTVAQPIQVSAKSRGLDHDASHSVARLVRSLAIDLYNNYHLVQYSQQITNALQEVFAEVAEVVELTSEDSSALQEIAEERARLVADAGAHAEKWRREISYEGELGGLFNKVLSIAPEGIRWNGKLWELDSITRIRWGGTKHSVNGIPTGTTYRIAFGTSADLAIVDLKKEKVYSEFVDRLWRSVGARLLTEFLEGLRDGKDYRFGGTVVKDHGIYLSRKKLFSSAEPVFCFWNDVLIGNGPGVFQIESKVDKKLFVVLSYQDEDNIHVLDSAIRILWKHGGERLSSLLLD